MQQQLAQSDRSNSENVKEYKTDYYLDKDSIPGGEIIDIVHEFLLKNGYFRTLDTFQEEIFSQTNSLDAYLQRANENFRFGQSILLEVSFLDIINIDV